MINSDKIAVIGGGSWATAIVKILVTSVDKVKWWMRNEDSIKHISAFGNNPKYLQSVSFDLNKIELSSDLEKVINSSEIIVMATPSAFLYQMFDGKEFPGIENKIIISAIKGIVPEYHAIPARFFHKQFGVPYDKIAIIAGPCHAEEVALERLSYLTLACQNIEIADQLADLFACRFINTCSSDDIFGIELSSVLKNVYAIAAGIFHGLGYGDNFQAVLVSNALQEIDRFIGKVDPIHRDVKKSGYMGDLLVTSYSQFSRNRTFGTMLGKGYSVNAAMMEMSMVAEGYYAVKSLMEINKKFEVDIPICESVYKIIYQYASPYLEMSGLTKKLS